MLLIPHIIRAMKHTTLLVALVATLCVACYSQSQPENVSSTRQGYYGDDNNPTPTLVGNIESVTVKSYYASGTLDSQTTYGVDTWNEYEFNERGDVTKRRICADDGTTFCTNHRTYNPQGNILKESEILPDGDTVYHYTYTYNSEGKLTEKRESDWEGIITTRYEYENGLLTLSNTYKTGDPTEVLETTRYVYNEEGKLTEESIETHAEQLHTHYNYIYGEGTTTTDHFMAALDEELPSHYRTRTICTYDPSGLLLREEILGVGGRPQGEVAFTYDAKGNTSSKIGSGVEKAYHHTYDSHGNVTRTIVTSRGDVDAIIEYEITYRE